MHRNRSEAYFWTFEISMPECTQVSRAQRTGWNRWQHTSHAWLSWVRVPRSVSQRTRSFRSGLSLSWSSTELNADNMPKNETGGDPAQTYLASVKVTLVSVRELLAGARWTKADAHLRCNTDTADEVGPTTCDKNKIGACRPV